MDPIRIYSDAPCLGVSKALAEIDVSALKKNYRPCCLLCEDIINRILATLLRSARLRVRQNLKILLLQSIS